MNLEKYPRVKAFLEKHPEMRFDEAFQHIENLCKEEEIL